MTDGEANTLDSLGYAHHLLSHHDQAINYYQQSVTLARGLGDHHGLGVKLNHLGDAFHAAGNRTPPATRGQRH